MKKTMKEHWNKVYSSNDTRKLGWYEEIPEPSIKLLSKCNISKDENADSFAFTAIILWFNLRIIWIIMFGTIYGT